MERNTDVPRITIMANHMGTWKYRFRMLSFTMANCGTGSKKPATAEYSSSTTVRIFHQASAEPGGWSRVPGTGDSTLTDADELILKNNQM